MILKKKVDLGVAGEVIIDVDLRDFKKEALAEHLRAWGYYVFPDYERMLGEMDDNELIDNLQSRGYEMVDKEDRLSKYEMELVMEKLYVSVEIGSEMWTIVEKLKSWPR